MQMQLHTYKFKNDVTWHATPKNVIHYGEISQNGSNILRNIEVTETIFYCNSLSYLYNSDRYNSNGCDCSIVHVFAWEGPCSTASADLHLLI